MAQQAMAFAPFVGAQIHSAQKTISDKLLVDENVLDRRSSTNVPTQELEWLRSVGTSATESLLRHDQSKRWQKVPTHPADADGVVLSQLADENICAIKGTITVFASLTEVMQVLSVKDPELVNQIFARYFGNVYTKACVCFQPEQDNFDSDRVLSVETLELNLSTGRTFDEIERPEHQTTSVRGREYTYLRFSEYIEVAGSNFQRSPGRTAARGGVCVWEGVDLKHGPPEGNSTFRKCGFIAEATPSTHQVNLSFILTQVLDTTSDRSGVLSSSDYFILQRMVRSVLLGFDGAVVDRRIFVHATVPKQLWSDESKCFICSKSFSFFRYKHHCRLCGEVVCTHCSLVRESGDKQSLRACTCCLEGTPASLIRTSAKLYPAIIFDDPTISPQSLESPVYGRPPKLRMPMPQPSPYRFHSDGLPGCDAIASDDAVRQPFASASDQCRPSPPPMHPRRAKSLQELSDQFEGFVDPKLGWSSKNRKPVAEKSLPSKKESQAMSFTTSVGDFITDSSPLTYNLTFKDGNTWPDPPHTSDENWRLQKATDLDLLRPHKEAHTYIKMACKTMQCPVGALTIIGGSNGLIISKVGVVADSLPRHIMLESHVLKSKDPLVVLDCHSDLRFMTNPLVCEGDIGIRFYIGVPLVTSDGCIVGALSVVDTRPRTKIRRIDLNTLVLTAQTLMRRFEDMAADKNMAGQSSEERFYRSQCFTSDLDID